MSGFHAEVAFDYAIFVKTMEGQELTHQATKVPLKKYDKDRLIEAIKLAPMMVSDWGFTPEYVVPLLEYNSDVALEFFVAIDAHPKKAQYFLSYLQIL